MKHITLGHLNINDIGKAYVMDALNSNRLSRGKYTERLEREFARLHQSGHAIFMNSGTSALQVALAALKEQYGYQDGDEVIVPSMTFIATSNIVLQNNMKPVFVDVDPVTFNINPDRILEKITDRTRVILPVHLFGLPADMPRITEIATYHGLQVLEDSCETMFAKVGLKTVGSWGQIACFSNYVAHFIVGGVGGLVTTNDSHLAELCRSLMAHGRDSIYLNIDDDDQAESKRLNNIIERRYSFDRVGYSYRATEMEAAVALSELERWQENITRRRMNALVLTFLLEPLKDFIQLPSVPKHFSHSFMMYPMVLADSVDRADFLLYLEEHGIETRYLLPLLGQPIYRKLFPGELEKNPVAKRLEEKGFFIGMHQGLTEEDIYYIAETIGGYFRDRSL